MEKDTFIKEIENSTLSDLEYIYRTQQEYYSEEEMESIKDTIEKKKLVEDVLKKDHTPDKQLTADSFFLLTLFCIISLVFPVSGLFNGAAMLIIGFAKKGSPEWKGAGARVLAAAIIGLLIRTFLGGVRFF